MIADVRLFARRRCGAVATIVLVLSVVATVATLAAARTYIGTEAVGGSDLVYVACQILPYGAVGALLVARRPDLPFGWLLSASAVALTLGVAVTGASVAALDRGRGGELATWGLTAATVMFVPAAVQGLVNVRFPSGSPSGRWGRLLERAIVVGIVLGLLSGLLGDTTVRAVVDTQPPARLIDATPLVDIGNALVVAIPLVILLGVVAGIGVVVRYLRSEGLERQQLRWRAAGVVGALVGFPFAVTETLPRGLENVEPLVFVTTLVVPVLRYDLWAIDSIVRRSARYTVASSGDVVDSLVRATGEMLHLPYLGVRRGDRLLASYGQPTGGTESWPLVHEGDRVGELLACPRHGYASLSEQERDVLATVAQLVAGSVRAEALTVDLLAARHRLVTAREEERRRLRRDLHDGLGPLITGLGLNLDAAATQVGRSDEKVAAYLGHAREASSQVIGSLRELVEGLRPPALDELGLADALRLQIARLAADGGLHAEVHLEEGLELPAAVEVAAYRAAVEAVTNVARHSGARSVCVELARSDGELALTVVDDGRARSPWAAGQGLRGMRERSEELGGRCTAGPTPDGGRILVTYPLEDR